MALNVDYIALSGIALGIGFVLAVVGFQDSLDDEVFWDIFGWIISIVYTLGFWTNKQATPGKMAIRARIVNAATLGKPSMGQFVGRYLAYLLSALPLGRGFLWVAIDRQNAAGTISWPAPWSCAPESVS